MNRKSQTEIEIMKSRLRVIKLQLSVADLAGKWITDEDQLKDFKEQHADFTDRHRKLAQEIEDIISLMEKGES